jgi:uncharacterized damage-inducible protein DinB
MKALITFAVALAFGVSAFAQGTKPAEQKEKPDISQAKTKADAQKAEKPAPPAQNQGPTSPSQVYERQLNNVEKEFVSAAEAMPADKYDFKPSTGEFEKSRTFKQQVAHVAATNYLFASGILGEKSPVTDAESETGPAFVTDKDSAVKYLKESFAYAHKAMQSITKDNIMQPGTNGRTPKMAIANLILMHGFDHYGQMAIYLRMNGIVPPASRAQ